MVRFFSEAMERMALRLRACSPEEWDSIVHEAVREVRTEEQRLLEPRPFRGE